MKAIEGLIMREVAGEHLLIPTGSAALEIQGLITLSESGYLLWNCLQSDCTEEELVTAILAEYDVERDVAAADVRDFLEQMQQVGVLEETEVDADE